MGGGGRRGGGGGKGEKYYECKENVIHLKQSPTSTASPEDAIKLYEVLHIMYEICSDHLSFLSTLIPPGYFDFFQLQ